MEHAVDCPSNSWLNSCPVLGLSGCTRSRCRGLAERAGQWARPGCSMHEGAEGHRDTGGSHGFVWEADGVFQPEEVEARAALQALGPAERELLL